MGEVQEREELVFKKELQMMDDLKAQAERITILAENRMRHEFLGRLGNFEDVVFKYKNQFEALQSQNGEFREAQKVHNASKLASKDQALKLKAEIKSLQAKVRVLEYNKAERSTKGAGHHYPLNARERERESRQQQQQLSSKRNAGASQQSTALVVSSDDNTGVANPPSSIEASLRAELKKAHLSLEVQRMGMIGVLAILDEVGGGIT
jgi:hypothetical protein